MLTYNMCYIGLASIFLQQNGWIEYEEIRYLANNIGTIPVIYIYNI